MHPDDPRITALAAMRRDSFAMRLGRAAARPGFYLAVPLAIGAAWFADRLWDDGEHTLIVALIAAAFVLVVLVGVAETEGARATAARTAHLLGLRSRTHPGAVMPLMRAQPTHGVTWWYTGDEIVGLGRFWTEPAMAGRDENTSRTFHDAVIVRAPRELGTVRIHPRTLFAALRHRGSPKIGDPALDRSHVVTAGDGHTVRALVQEPAMAAALAESDAVLEMEKGLLMLAWSPRPGGGDGAVYALMLRAALHFADSP